MFTKYAESLISLLSFKCHVKKKKKRAMSEVQRWWAGSRTSDRAGRPPVASVPAPWTWRTSVATAAAAKVLASEPVAKQKKVNRTRHQGKQKRSGPGLGDYVLFWAKTKKVKKNSKILKTQSISKSWTIDMFQYLSSSEKKGCTKLMVSASVVAGQQQDTKFPSTPKTSGVTFATQAQHLPANCSRWTKQTVN